MARRTTGNFAHMMIGLIRTKLKLVHKRSLPGLVRNSFDRQQGRWKQFEIGCAKKLKGKGGKKETKLPCPFNKVLWVLHNKYQSYKYRGSGAGWAFAHPVFRKQNRNSLTSNLQSIKMKICRVVPILDTVGHITNYTWIGPAVIVNLIKILFVNYSWYSCSCDHLRLG